MRKASMNLLTEHFSEQIEYLGKRGLTLEHIEKLKIEFCGATKLSEENIDWAGVDKGILWRIRDANGDLTGAIGVRVFYAKGFASSVDRPKFATPKGQTPRLYHSLLADWSHLERGSTVVLCESFLKSDIASLCGFHGVGVSGVWGWSHQKTLISDFTKLPWKELGVNLVVCFDSNVGPDGKDLLNLAVERFAAEMEKLGCKPKIAYLPKKDDGSDWGLDDFYAVRGPDAVRELIDGAVEVETGLTQHMVVMNNEVAVVRSLNRIVDLANGVMMSREQFVKIRFAHRKAWTNDGKPLSIAGSWLEWPNRNEVDDIVYIPGEECIVVRENGQRSYNTWQGMGIEPKRDDSLTKLWVEWLELAFPNVEERDWFCCWWAVQLQQLGIKLTTALVLVGVSGVGKGWVAEIMKSVFGMKNTAVCDMGTLAGRFNADFAMKQLVVVEEGEERSSDADKIYGRIKDLITNSHVRVERKGLDAFVTENRVNVMLQGNKVDMIKLDEYDRRLAILEVDGEHLANREEFWEVRWNRIGEMAAAVYEWLLRYDISGFNPKGKPPMTQAKSAMMESTSTPRELWVAELKANYKDVMIVNGELVDGPIATAKELEYVYQNGDVPMWEIDKRMADAMSRALKLARVPLANAGNKIRSKQGINRYFLLERGYASDAWGDVVNERKFWNKIYTAKSKI